ncbi:hypothetical protein PTKIN_Ptkin09bG0018500 [Pterospermum kingtungense]
MALPNDIIISDILCRLGVEDLLRFREFDHLFSVDFDSLETATKLHHPLDVRHDGRICTKILGSCNGLLALHYSLVEIICLWNPSTRKSHMLPVTEADYPPIFYTNRSKFRYGFGYEPISDDYKLIRMVQFEELRGGDYTLETEVRVYSLRTNSWRRIEDFPFRFIEYFQPNGVLANHALHWVVRNKSISDTKSIVVAFDLGSEEYRVVPLPDGLGEVVDVTGLEGSFCLISSYRNAYVTDIWVMEEYGVKESWTKLISLKHPDDLWQEKHYWECFDVFPLAYSKSGHILLLERGLMDQDDGDLWYSRFLWYDLTSKKAKRVMIQGGPESFYNDAYMLVQCLVPPAN